jgi:hypothetical protein
MSPLGAATVVVGDRRGFTVGRTAVDPRLRRRVGGPTWHVIVDVVRQARSTRNWLILALLVVAVVAALSAVFAQTVLPWAIYPL